VYKAEGNAAPANLPIMVQVEGYESNKSYLRLSIRGAANAEAVKNLYQLITLYVLPA